MKRGTLILLGILAAVGSPAAGDWLVTRAGGRVETKGPWQTKGKLVVFTQTDGSLASLRLTEVDLEASRKATSEAAIQKEKAAAPEPPKKKLAVLTDQSFRKPPAVISATQAPPAEEGVQPVASGTGGPLTVSAWKRVDLPGSGGVEIQGTLHNTTDYLIVNPSVEVRLYDHAGDSIASAFGVLSNGAIQPRSTIDFRASLPGAFDFAEVKFEPRGLPLAKPVAPQPEDPAPPQ
jgi:hypothetical protein